MKNTDVRRFKRTDKYDGEVTSVPRSMVARIARLNYRDPDGVMAKADQGLCIVESPLARYELLNTRTGKEGRYEKTA